MLEFAAIGLEIVHLWSSLETNVWLYLLFACCHKENLKALGSVKKYIQLTLYILYITVQSQVY